ncbi:hypothetical protein ACQ4PT_024513 [Festuca glaucescens]
MAEAGRRVVFFPFPYHGHSSPVLRLASALHARGFAVTVFHTEFRAPDRADSPADYGWVSLPVEDRLAALLASEEGGVRCVITDVIWYTAQAVARDLGVPALGIMTASAANFRLYMAFQTLIDNAYLPEEDPVEELPPTNLLLQQDASSLPGLADLFRRTVEGARQSSGLVFNTLSTIEAANLWTGSARTCPSRCSPSPLYTNWHRKSTLVAAACTGRHKQTGTASADSTRRNQAACST